MLSMSQKHCFCHTRTQSGIISPGKFTHQLNRPPVTWISRLQGKMKWSKEKKKKNESKTEVNIYKEVKDEIIKKTLNVARLSLLFNYVRYG